VADATVETVRRAYALVRRGNPAELLELIAPDATWTGVEDATWEPCTTGEQVAKTLLWRGAVHRLRGAEFVDVGNQVVVGVTGRRLGRLGAPWWAWKFFQVVTVRDGKLVRIQDYARRADAFAAVGLKV
jgi:ketosteroid isomerase-like protein